MPIKVILDSNFLFVPVQFQIDIFSELENLLSQKVDAILLSSTFEELKKLAESKSPKMRRQASLALKFAEKCRLVEVNRNAEESNDDVIVRVASLWKCPVATNDLQLKKRLRNINVAVIYLRQKSRLNIEGSVNYV
ncbi:MAG: hypothetical protein QXN63_02610 [Candidatus Bathyarchaeia archaeon]